jgi:hypothetical protein
MPNCAARTRSRTSQYAHNFYFRAKTALLVLAGCNMTAFHRIGTREIARWDAAGGTPVAAKTLGGISLLVWIAVVVCGRWIGFTLH